jgi:hypothetical protein
VATIVPNREEIRSLPPPLTDGELRLLDALEKSLDDDWTVYVQPHLNGLRPDFVIFSPKAGIGIIEVKDWNLERSRVSIDDSRVVWEVLDRYGIWQKPRDNPLEQVEKYYRTLLEYQLSEVYRRALTDSAYFGVIRRFIFFSASETAGLHKRIPPLARRHVTVFGEERLAPDLLRRTLQQGGLMNSGRFEEVLREPALRSRLENALGYPEHGNIDPRLLRFADLTLTEKQHELRPNDARGRRVAGAAGTGKSVLAALKAVDAAEHGRIVFLTCYNITMANYLHDVVMTLSRQRGPHVHRNIEVSHFHGAFDPSAETDHRNLGDRSIDVLLVDEGQDFEREWIELMYRSCTPEHHFMFFEDERQNVYGRDARTKLVLPGVKGRRNVLNSSLRVSPEVARLANALARRMSRANDVDLESIQPRLFSILPVWHNCATLKVAVDILVADVISNVERAGGSHPADVAVLVCTDEDGRAVLDRLAATRQPAISMLPGQATIDGLSRRPGDLKKLERALKIEFRMQTGRVKVCTIHSFKGWELKHIYILFHPSSEQQSVALELLYTAVTRAQSTVTIYNAAAPFQRLGGELSRTNIVEGKNRA